MRAVTSKEWHQKAQDQAARKELKWPMTNNSLLIAEKVKNQSVTITLSSFSVTNAI